MMETSALIAAFTSLFLIIDPPGLVPMFVALTSGMSAKARRAIAIRSCLVAAVLMALFLLAGEAVLNFVGISMPAFRIAGGVMLFLTALDMLFERRQSRRKARADNAQAESIANADSSSDDDDDDDGHDPSVFPLAIPLIVGPGAITTIILLASTAQGAADFFAIAAVIGAILGIVLLSFLAAPFIERVLGDTGINVVTRVLGMLLAALSVQFILDGLRGAGLGG